MYTTNHMYNTNGLLPIRWGLGCCLMDEMQRRFGFRRLFGRQIGLTCRSFTPFHFLFLRHFLRWTHPADYTLSDAENNTNKKMCRWWRTMSRSRQKKSEPSPSGVPCGTTGLGVRNYSLGPPLVPKSVAQHNGWCWLYTVGRMRSLPPKAEVFRPKNASIPLRWHESANPFSFSQSGTPLGRVATLFLCSLELFSFVVSRYICTAAKGSFFFVTPGQQKNVFLCQVWYLSEVQMSDSPEWPKGGVA